MVHMSAVRGLKVQVSTHESKRRQQLNHDVGVDQPRSCSFACFLSLRAFEADRAVSKELWY